MGHRERTEVRPPSSSSKPLQRSPTKIADNAQQLYLQQQQHLQEHRVQGRDVALPEAMEPNTLVRATGTSQWVGQQAAPATTHSKDTEDVTDCESIVESKQNHRYRQATATARTVPSRARYGLKSMARSEVERGGRA